MKCKRYWIGLGFFLNKTNLCAKLCNKNTFALILFLPTVALLSQHYANVVSPVGVPKDILPPLMVDTYHESHTLNIDGQRIMIVFDGSLMLDNANHNVLISSTFSKNQPSSRTTRPFRWISTIQLPTTPPTPTTMLTPSMRIRQRPLCAQETTQRMFERNTQLVAAAYMGWQH